ncbi:hypothetical protein GCM10009678_71660 [Actinomadura kijaniata]|uniref:Uncharacterized protein n=1 Tax=Actinomadura namibiensis TaxID=182080 RepID=A0A7W3LS75_ACTNM|nr:hypothetical protein [Actinomadura namibiensis]MBA8953237.1 hypothetical protein [Actinomadura namibiensis]
MRRTWSVLACFVPLLAGGAWYVLTADWTLPILRFEFAWNAETARHLTTGREDDYRTALHADFAFLAGYAVTIAALCLLAARRERGRGVRWLGAAAGVLAALLDVVENLLLLDGLTALHRDTAGDLTFRGAALAAAAKFALVIPAGIIALGAASSAASRTRR